MESEPLIIVQARAEGKGNISHELRKRGLNVLSSLETEHFTYAVTSMSHKLIIKLSLQENLTLTPVKKYSSYQALKLANSCIEIILRSISIGASAAWVAHNPTIASTITNESATDAALTDTFNYYGSYIALSMGFQSLSVYYLQGQALVASLALLEILRNPAGASAAWLPFYCSYLQLWGTYYLQRWNQRKAALLYAWGVTEEPAIDVAIVQESTVGDDLKHWQHCLLSALATLSLAVVLLLLAVPMVRFDTFVAAILTSGASPPHTQTPRQMIRFARMVMWALVPYVVGDNTLQRVCVKLTAFECHVNQLHAEQSHVLKQVLLYGAAHYTTLLYRTLYMQDHLAVLQMAMLAQLTAHVLWMLHRNHMLLREPDASEIGSAASSMTEELPTTMEGVVPSDKVNSGDSPDTRSGISGSSRGSDIHSDAALSSDSASSSAATGSKDTTATPTLTTAAAPATENKVDTAAPTTSIVTSAALTAKTDINSGGNTGTGSTTIPNNADSPQNTNRSKATPLSPANANTTTSGNGSDSPSRFGFIPALLKRTVVDPGLQSAKQAVTGDIRGAASTVLGAAASATKEGADLLSTAASAVKITTLESADAAVNKVTEVASTTASSAAAAADTVASTVTLGAVHLAVPEQKSQALVTPAASSSPARDAASTSTPHAIGVDAMATITTSEAVGVTNKLTSSPRPTDSNSATTAALYTDLLTREMQLPIYDVQKEYLYTTILYGYLVLFSLLCPITPLLVLLVQYLQGNVTRTHLARCRRPALTHRSNLEYWQSCWAGLSLLSLCLSCLTLALAPTSTTVANADDNSSNAPEDSAATVWTFLLSAALAHNRVLCLLVLHQVLLLARQCITYFIPDSPYFITQEIARTRLQQVHLQTKQRLLKHAQALHATSLYQEDVHSTADMPVAGGQSQVQSSEGLYATLRSTAGSALHMPLQLAGTLRSTVLNATNSITNVTQSNHTSTRQADYDIQASTIPNITSSTPVLSPRDYHLSRLLQQLTTSPYTFNPFNMTLLTLLPILLHQLNISIWVYIPLAVLYFSYLQVAKDRIDRKLAVGIIADPNLIKFVLSEMPSWVSDSQYQRVEWLNGLLGKLWPTLSTALEPIVLSKLQPLLDDVCPKVLGRILISRFSLGTVSPKIVGVRLFDTSENTIRLDVELRWAGDPSVIIHVGASQVYTPIEVSEIRLSATLRVELIDIHPTLPFFRAVSLTFLHKPVLDFSLTVARLDVMNIGPGDYNVASMVRHLLHSVLSDAILYPKRVVIPMSGSGGGNVAEPVGLVSVTFVQAMHLQRASMFGSDPYVVARIASTVQQKQGDQQVEKTDEIDQEQEQQKEQHQEQHKEQHQEQQQMQEQVQEVRSSVKYSTQDPVWMESHDLIVFDQAQAQQQQHIHFEVHHQGDLTHRNSSLGHCTVPLSRLTPYTKQRLVLPLQGVSTRSLEVECEYIPLVSDEKKKAEGDKSSRAKTDHSDMDVLYPDLPLEREKAEAMLRGTDPDTNEGTHTAAAAVEEEKVREEQEQKQVHHYYPQLHKQEVQGTERGAKTGFKGTGTSDSGSSTPSSSSRGDGEEEERVAGDYGDEDDLWTDREVAAVAAQLLRTLSDPTAVPPSTTTAATSAWDNSLGGAGEAVMHTAGALSVSGIHVRNLKLNTSSGGISGSISSAASGGGGFFSGPTRCYVQCAVGSVQRRTKAVQSNEAPVFTEAFYFVSKQPADEHLRVSVRMEPAEKELGSVEIPFAEVLHAPGRLLQQEYMLQGTGELRECYVSLKLHWASAAVA